MGQAVNNVVLVGRLANDPELTYTEGGTAIAKFRLAVDRFTKKGEEQVTDWIPIVTWGTTAENCAQYLSKGKLVAIEGAIQTRSWDGDDGKKRYGWDVNGRSVQFLSPKSESGDGSGGASSGHHSAPAYDAEVNVGQDDEDPFADQ